MSKREKRLSCGAKGPCCHVPYPHRHCESCEEVIAIYDAQSPRWSGSSVWGANNGSETTSAPVRLTVYEEAPAGRD